MPRFATVETGAFESQEGANSWQYSGLKNASLSFLQVTGETCMRMRNLMGRPKAMRWLN